MQNVVQKASNATIVFSLIIQIKLDKETKIHISLQWYKYPLTLT